MRKIIIAIDGTSASGKGFVSKSISNFLLFPALDTGSLYRACTLRVLENFYFPTICSDAQEFENFSAAFDCNLLENFFADNEKTRMMEDLKNFRDTGDIFKYVQNELIRTQLISKCVPFISKIPEVRLLMHEYQINFAKNPPAMEGQNLSDIKGCIVEGRDIGTEIFPNADLKLFITASAQARATRRLKDFQKKTNNTATYEEVLSALHARDEQDMNRSFCPLKPASDAIIIDTTDMDKNQVLEHVQKIIAEKIGTKLSQ